MKSTRSAEFVVNNTKIQMTVSKDIFEKTEYFDGYNMGQKTIESNDVQIKVSRDGKSMNVRGNKLGDYAVCEKVEEKYNKMAYDKGARGRIGSGYVGQEIYDAICETYEKLSEEIEAELPSIEKQPEIKPQKVSVHKEHGVGWCDKCQSYCFGDCQE